MRRRPFDRMPLALRRALFPWLEMISPRRSRKRRVFADLSVAGLEQYARLLEFFPPEQKRRLIAPRWRSEFRDYDDYWYFRQFWRGDVDPLTRIQYLDLKTYLPDDILTKVDRASMAVSLEVRPPLLDHILVEQVISIPSHLRAPGGERKYLLKSAFEDSIPAVILNRPKRGFSAPLTNWMSAQQGWARERLRTGGDGESLLGAGLDELGEPYDSGTRRWALLVLQQWLSEKAGAARLDPSDEGLAMPAGA
jgi:asparagine synthase (glutamine-hydrolysing)